MTHTPCQNEYCPTCHPTLATINAELDTLWRRMDTADGTTLETLRDRYFTLLDAQWAALPASGLYSQVSE